MEMYRNTIGKQSTLVLSTNSGLYRFLKSSDAVNKTSKSLPKVVAPAGSD